MLQAAVLLRQLAQPPRLAHPQSAVLRSPAVVTLLADLLPAAQLADVRPGLALLQNASDPLLRETALPDPGSSFAAKISWESQISTGPLFGEQTTLTRPGKLYQRKPEDFALRGPFPPISRQFFA